MMILFCIIALFVLIILYSLVENRYIKTVCYTLLVDKNKISILPEQIHAVSENANRIHLVQLSDLHNCSYGKNNASLVERVKACKPDVVLVTGDMINKYQAVNEEMYELFAQLAKVCPCIYSLGNHELKERKKNPERFSDYIHKVQNCGIIVSDNERHKITIKNKSILFASYSSDLQQYKRRNLGTQNKTSAAIPCADGEEIAILLSHDPELREEYVATAYSVIFSGHLHGGIVRIPGWRGIISTRFVMFPAYDGGCYSLDDRHVLVVSRGLGSHTIKFRLFNRPELVHAVIEFKA